MTLQCFLGQVYEDPVKIIWVGPAASDGRARCCEQPRGVPAHGPIMVIIIRLSSTAPYVAASDADAPSG